MQRLLCILSSSLFISVVLLAICLFQVRTLWKDFGHQDLTAAKRADELVLKAELEFSQGHDAPAITLLSAALLADPDNDQALDAYRNRLRAKFDAGLKEHDWDLCELQVAAYDAVVRSALRGAVSAEDVQSIIQRQDEVARWENEAAQKQSEIIAHELDTLEKEVSSASRNQLELLNKRLRLISPDNLSDALRDRLTALALVIVEMEQKSLRLELQVEFDGLEKSAKKEDLATSKLHELRIQGEYLNGKIVEAKLQGSDLTAEQAACQGLLAQLERRIQVLSIRQMQTIADADAKKAIAEARSILELIDKDTSIKTGHARGRKLAEAEIGLNQIDRLCSTACQIEANQLLEEIRRRAIAQRTQQTRDYNLWAIKMLEESIGDYAKAKGWFNDDEEAFKKVLGEKVGRIDPQLLHPVTYSLFADMFQKFLSELSSSDKVAVTRVVEEMQRRPLSDF
ncbi:MAG: hypothetical protein K8U03_07115 [Planctomycetia bacterium]|nr:hypothetical protein [Planctomycetia bacterium]